MPYPAREYRLTLSTMGITNWFRVLLGSSGPWHLRSERIAPKPVRLHEHEGFRLYTIHVAGVSFRQGVVAQIREGEQLLLAPEPTNKHDKNAIKVCRLNGELIGYLPREVSERVLLDAPARWRLLDPEVRITASLYGDHIKCVMLHVLIPKKRPKAVNKKS